MMKRKTSLQLAVALGLVLASDALVSCKNDFDYYDPDYVKQQYAESWEKTFGEIDSEQDWSMVTKASVNITADEAGTVYVYDSDPLSEANTPKCMLMMTTDGKSSINSVIDIEKGLKCVYVALYNEAGYLRVIPAVVEDGNVSVSFGQASVAKNAARKTKSIKRDVTYSWVNDDLKGIIEKGVVSIPNDIKNVTDVNEPSNSNAWDVSSYYITSDYSQWVAKAGVSFYVKGEDVSLTYLNAQSVWDSNAGRTVGPNVYVLPNSKLTITGSGFPNGTVLYVAPGAELDFSGSKQMSYFYIWNQGTVNVNGNLTLAGNTSSFINDDGGVVTVKDTTIVNSYGTQWINDGNWTTGSMKLTSASATWINGCHLSVADSLCVNLGDGSPETANLRIDGGASVETRILKFDHGTIYQGSKSLIKVTEEAIFGNFKFNTGIIGPTEGDYAVLQMKKATAQKAEQGYSACYHNKLYVACNNHFANGFSGNYPIIYVDGAEMTAENGAPITIDASACNPGYDNTPVAEPEVNPISFIFACEDLGGTDDYDFNDIVFSVSHVAGQKTATVKALAAGGTYPATIYYKSSETDSVAIGEIHARLNPNASTAIMLNTNEDASLNTYKDAGVQITVPENWSISENRSNFGISINSGTTWNGVYLTQTIESAMELGKAPQVIVLPSDWEWPIERVKMTEAYPDFKNWSANSSSYDWINSKVSSKVVSR
jgi:hypothetical protein